MRMRKKIVQMICWQRLKTKKSTEVHRSIGPFLFCSFSVWFRFSIYLHTQCFMQRKIIHYMYCVCCEHTSIDPMKEKVDMRWRWLIALCLARIQQFFEQHVGISCNDREILDKIGYAQKTAAATATTKTSIIGNFWVIFLRISHHYRWIINTCTISKTIIKWNSSQRTHPLKMTWIYSFQSVCSNSIFVLYFFHYLLTILSLLV